MLKREILRDNLLQTITPNKIELRQVNNFHIPSTVYIGVADEQINKDLNLVVNVAGI